MGEFKGGIIILSEMAEKLPKSENKIARYILSHPEEAVQLTAAKLGEKSGTSSAAVIRLCKSIGFSGFQELKIRVAGDLKENHKESYRDINPKEDVKDIIGKVTQNTIRMLNETVDIMNEKEIEQAVELLSKAKSIIFLGFGGSYIAAKDAEQKFMRIGKVVHAFSDTHMAATLIANKGMNDVVVGISFSGNTPEVARLLELANSKGVSTIGITKYGRTLVGEQADIKLFISPTGEATLRSGATSSRMAQLHVIDILLMCIASREYENTMKQIDETRDSISFLRKNK
ncbi:MurR/RpiR family transcriptional regulator [Jeotgalibacillus sp. JSM ZJ347]|uniref:MurR/RpiR family transcriptional regulator n=1 Tax=Jeotgalibacillus sp. JSM ZJ347 TaxID=3342117 RepID=UPI0035A95150